MYCIEICFELSGGHWVCFPIYCPDRPIRFPQDLPWLQGSAVRMHLNGERPDWLSDVNALGMAAHAASNASGEISEILKAAVTRSIDHIGNTLPANVKINTHEHIPQPA